MTGGSAAILSEKTGEEDTVAKNLERLKFPKEKWLMEGALRNPYENAFMTAELLEERGAVQESFLLCTDGWHMRRAAACFRKAGLKVIPFSTSGEHLLLDEPTPNHLLVPDMRGFERWSKLAKQVVSYCVYWATGKVRLSTRLDRKTVLQENSFIVFDEESVNYGDNRSGWFVPDRAVAGTRLRGSRDYTKGLLFQYR